MINLRYEEYCWENPKRETLGRQTRM